MRLGIRLRKLWRLRVGVGVSLLVALVAGAWSAEKISLFPPHLTPRKLEMGSATTHIVVDRPRSMLIDLKSDTYDFEQLSNRAILLGNVIANGAVHDMVAKSVNVPPDQLLISAPRTSKQPQAVADPKTQKHTSDILKSNDEYRLTIVANPTVPVLDIYAQAPDANAAARLANAAYDGLQSYLHTVARQESTPADSQIRLIQLGRAQGSVVNPSAHWQVAVLAFLVTFGFSCATVIYVDRVRKGWKLAAISEGVARA
jgi:hypothetical protein